MAVTQQGPAPYTAPASVLDLIRRYRERGLQSPFTRDVLVRAQVAETLVTRTLQTLAILDLIDDKGMPTPTLEGLRRAPQGEYQQRFAEFLRAAYQEVFAYIDPTTNTFEEIRDAFRVYEPHGQQERMVTLFLGLCEEAGILGESARQRQAARDPQQQQRPARLRAAGTMLRQRMERVERKTSSVAPTSGKLPPAIVGLLNSLPQDGQAWTQRRRNDFLKTFSAVVDFCYPIGDDQSEQAEQDS